MRMFLSAMVLGFILTAGALPLPMQAQGGRSSQAAHRGFLSPDEELAHLTEALHLSGEQQGRVRPLLQNRRDQLLQIRGDRNLSREGKGAKMKAVDDDANAKLLAILNDQQKPRYQEMIQHRKERVAQQTGR